MTLLDGKILSKKIIDDVKVEIKELKSRYNRSPGLAVILVGSDTASKTYVSMKKRACEDVGIYSVSHDMPFDMPFDMILDTITLMNKNSNIDAILVQLPLPKNVDKSSILEIIDPKKDVDGFHAFNMGRLSLNLSGFVPCTPLGVMELLNHYNLSVEGKNVCIVGASSIVGKPMASLLINANATVDVCNVYTKDLKEHTKRADILISGVGKVNLISEDMIKEGAVVIDIGINRVDGGGIVGDVDFEHVKSRCSYITPVPGGVGPMTIAMLLKNTLQSFKKRIAQDNSVNKWG